MVLNATLVLLLLLLFFFCTTPPFVRFLFFFFLVSFSFFIFVILFLGPIPGPILFCFAFFSEFVFFYLVSMRTSLFSSNRTSRQYKLIKFDMKLVSSVFKLASQVNLLRKFSRATPLRRNKICVCFSISLPLSYFNSYFSIYVKYI